MWFHCVWKQEALSWPWANWYFFKFTVTCLLCSILVNTIAAISIFLQYRTSKVYRQWDPLEFQLFKTPGEQLLTLFGCAISWCYCFIVTFLDISCRDPSVASPTAPASPTLVTTTGSPRQAEAEPGLVGAAAKEGIGSCDHQLSETTSSLVSLKPHSAGTIDPLLDAGYLDTGNIDTTGRGTTMDEPPMNLGSGSGYNPNDRGSAGLGGEDVLTGSGSGYDSNSRMDRDNTGSGLGSDEGMIAEGSVPQTGSEYTADIRTSAERDNASNNDEGNISGDDDDDDGDDISAGTELVPSTPKLLPDWRLESPELPMEPWSAMKSINRVSQNSSAESPTPYRSAALGLRIHRPNWIYSNRVETRTKSPTQYLIAASSKEQRHNTVSRYDQPLTTATISEQASSDIRHKMSSTPFQSLSKPPRWRVIRREQKKTRGVREILQLIRRDLGSPPAMRWAQSDAKASTLPVSPVSPQGVLSSHELSPPFLPTNEDSNWEAPSRPVTPVREDNILSSGTRVCRNSAPNPHYRGPKDTGVFPATSLRKDDTPCSRDSKANGVGLISRTPVCQSNALSPRTPALGLYNPESIVSRVTYKEILLTMMQEWRPSDDLQKLKDLIHYEDDEDYPNLLDETEIMQERKRYEHYARDKTICRDRPFHIYGTNELFGHDCLRSWVKLHRHFNPKTPFPPHYTPITNDSDIISPTGTLFTQSSQFQESDDYESTSSESGDPKPNASKFGVEKSKK